MRPRAEGNRGPTTKSGVRQLNAAWHAKHRMPKNPSIEQRTVWHVAHAKACGCRPIPESVLVAIQRKNV